MHRYKEEYKGEGCKGSKVTRMDREEGQIQIGKGWRERAEGRKESKVNGTGKNGKGRDGKRVRLPGMDGEEGQME